MEIDHFAQQMLEKAAKRNQALGINNTAAIVTKQYLSEDVIDYDNKENHKTISDLKEVRRENGTYLYATSLNENANLDIEIQVKTDRKYDEVRVEVEEQEINEDENEKSSVKDGKITEVRIRDCSRNRLQRLGALYSNKNDLSSPIHRTEEQFFDEDADCTGRKEGITRTKNRFGKLAALASTINQWEDQSSHSNNSHQMKKTNLSKENTSSDLIEENNLENKPLLENNDMDTGNEVSENNGHESDKAKQCIKQLNWDPNIINSLEAQGFQKRESTTIKYSYEYSKKNQETSSSSGTVKDAPEKQNLLPRSGLVSDRAALFEKKDRKESMEVTRIQKDPTELSLKERRKLFEKNKGEPPIPKAPLAIAPPISKLITDKKTAKDNPTETLIKTDKIRNCVNDLEEATTSSYVKTEAQKQRQLELESLNKRFDKTKQDFLKSLNDDKKESSKNLVTLAQNSQIKAKVDALNAAITSKRPAPPPPPPPAVEVCLNAKTKRRSPTASSNEEESKRPRNENKRLYPVLADVIESEDCVQSDFCGTSGTTVSVKNISDDVETEIEKESSFLSVRNDGGQDGACRNEEPVACFKQMEEMIGTQDRREVQQDIYQVDSSANYDSSCNSSIEVDDLLDEALGATDESGHENMSVNSTGTVTSNSFSFRKPPAFNDEEDEKVQTSKHMELDNHYTQPIKSELKINETNDNMVTLVHTVSFYRRQQCASQTSTPTRKICLPPNDLFAENAKTTYEYNSDVSRESCTNSENLTDDKDLSEEEDYSKVEEKIKRLLEEVCKQQQIISQTSQALNLCAATVEFSGSTESVEGERHLLVATHRRQACLDEVQRLRVEKSIRPLAAPREKGRLTVKEITIPLRQDYIRKLSADTISGHHLVCLLKYNEHVLSTKTVPTLPGLLAVKFPDILQLDNVFADFRVTLEIFGMTAQREVLPHEVKYHINLNKKSGIKTPKKKGSENRLVMPPVQSPAGPNAVRTPALVQYGFAIFSLREIQRTSWSLTQVLGVSPLEGTIHMKVNCELSVSVEHKGFLTMFEDISGFGAWHRRWCFLNGTMLNYWKYPDDETKKAPMGSIDLYTCVSQKVAIVPRDICARLNTILLECERPRKETDEASLVIVPNGRTTIVRHLLSADTKEEREEWCAHFNKALTLLRAWGPPQ